jgi:hypothetical protein
MLAGIEEALQAGFAGEVQKEMTAIETLLAGLFDYAGLFPPASLELRSAANNYLDYSRGARSSALGRFINSVDRLGELRAMAGKSLRQFRISAIVADMRGLDAMAQEIRDGMPIETLEMKYAWPEEIDRIVTRIPQQLSVYVEVPVNAGGRAALKFICAAGARAKIRMGGVVPEAFPSVHETIQTLAALAELRLAFKATAGLHHPVRSCRALSYQPQSATGTMHGFVNLCCAAAVLYFGGNASEAEELLLEEEASAWHFSPDALQWRDLKWTTDKLALLRREFFHSIGSCSFEEPMHDLEALGWL